MTHTCAPNYYSLIEKQLHKEKLQIESATIKIVEYLQKLIANINN